jgi:AGCS family alanine or glycine:cation symporter
VALNEPFVDTVVICTMTALVIVITGPIPRRGLDGVQLTSAAFAETISCFRTCWPWRSSLFAFSTMISFSYYGVKAWTYLFGEGTNRKRVQLIFASS